MTNKKCFTSFKIIITRCDKKLLQCVIDISNCDRLKQIKILLKSVESKTITSAIRFDLFLALISGLATVLLHPTSRFSHS